MVEREPVIWSAAACEFPRAGVYLGLAEEFEHLTVARSLNPRQMRMFVGGHMQAPGAPSVWPLVYYAVRDPSAVRVQPVESHSASAPKRHVRLHFRFEHLFRAAVVISAFHGTRLTTPSGFLMSIGMRAEHEEGFYHLTVNHHQDQTWSDLFERVAAAGAAMDNEGRFGQT